MVSCSARPGTTAAAPRPAPGGAGLSPNAPQHPGQAAKRDTADRGPLRPLGRDQRAQQRGHRRALIGEHPDITLRAGQRERPGQGVHRGVLLAGGRQCESPQRADLDDAARPVLADGRRVQPLQQRERRARAVLGEQHPGQHQVLGLPRVAGFVVRAEAAMLRPAGGCGDLALGQLQPGPLRRDRVEQAGHARARPGLHGLLHRLPGAGRVALGLADPRQRGQAGGQRLGEVHLAARPDSLADVPEGRVELVPLVGHLGQAHVRDADGGQSSPAGRRGDLERLAVGASRGVQATLGPLDLAEVLVAPGSHGGLAARPSRACCDGCRPGTFVPDAAAQDSTRMGTFG
jgi:hypothetical protein